MAQKHHYLALSAWHHKAIADMGINAWYLTPLIHESHKEDQPHEELIDTLVESIEQTPPVSAASTPEIPAPVAAPVQPSTQQHATAQQQADKGLQKISARKTIEAPAPISISTKENTPTTEPPSSVTAQALKNCDWKALEEKITNAATTENKPCFIGFGNTAASDVIVLEEPDHRMHQESPLLAEREQHLLHNILESIGITESQTYITRLTKHASHLGLPPEKDMLEQQLTFLNTELTLIQPQRVWLFGLSPCRALLHTEAPLSALMHQQHSLQLLGEANTHTAQVLCLPSLDYLLALPAEKAHVWQSIKTHSLHNQ